VKPFGDAAQLILLPQYSINFDFYSHNNIYYKHTYTFHTKFLQKVAFDLVTPLDNEGEKCLYW